MQVRPRETPPNRLRRRMRTAPNDALDQSRADHRDCPRRATTPSPTNPRIGRRWPPSGRSIETRKCGHKPTLSAARCGGVRARDPPSRHRATTRRLAPRHESAQPRRRRGSSARGGSPHGRVENLVVEVVLGFVPGGSPLQGGRALRRRGVAGSDSGARAVRVLPEMGPRLSAGTTSRQDYIGP